MRDRQRGTGRGGREKERKKEVVRGEKTEAEKKPGKEVETWSKKLST